MVLQVSAPNDLRMVLSASHETNQLMIFHATSVANYDDFAAPSGDTEIAFEVK